MFDTFVKRVSTYVAEEKLSNMTNNLFSKE
jgi:hypothetical protein